MLVQLLLVLLLLFIVIGLLLPQSYNVTKSININANTHIVKPLITDFSQWHKWSPWKKLDPSVEFSLGEPSTGVGAHQSWQSKWGAGEMTTTALSANKMVLNILFAQEHIIAANSNIYAKCKNGHGYFSNYGASHAAFSFWVCGCA